MLRLRRVAAFVSLALIALVIVMACDGPGPSPDPITQVGAADAVAMLDERIVLDVRTPAEYQAGHVAGARNIDVEGADFEARIGELDKGEAYLLYCRSGRRSALAAERMAQGGFTDIVDAGGLEALADAGAPIE